MDTGDLVRIRDRIEVGLLDDPASASTVAGIADVARAEQGAMRFCGKQALLRSVTAGLGPMRTADPPPGTAGFVGLGEPPTPSDPSPESLRFAFFLARLFCSRKTASSDSRRLLSVASLSALWRSFSYLSL